MNIILPSGLTVVKIGKSSGHSSKERMQQINGSIFDKFRTTAMISIKRDREVDTDFVFKYETTLHHFFADYQYNTPHKFDGYSECFVIPLEDAVQAYEAVISGEVPDFKYVLPEKVAEDSPPF